MKYRDADTMPRTADAYEREMRSRARLTATDARTILKEHDAGGWRNMTPNEAMSAAMNDYRDEAVAAVEAKVIWLRWPIAHAFGLSYKQLSAIERAAGVYPDTGTEGSAGAYRSLSDAVAVINAARERCEAGTATVHVRLGTDDELDSEAVRKVYEAISRAFDCSEPVERTAEGRKKSFTNVFFDVLVPDKGSE